MLLERQRVRVCVKERDRELPFFFFLLTGCQCFILSLSRLSLSFNLIFLVYSAMKRNAIYFYNLNRAASRLDTCERMKCKRERVSEWLCVCCACACCVRVWVVESVSEEHVYSCSAHTSVNSASMFYPNDKFRNKNNFIKTIKNWWTNIWTNFYILNEQQVK